MKKAVTIKDIAEQLGLSRNTVAKALNGRHVPEKTRELVLEKAKELDYKCLRSQTPTEEKLIKRNRILLFSGKPLNNMNFFVPIIKGIENFCFNNSYELFQYTFNEVVMTFTGILNYIKTLELDGIIAIECFNRNFNEKLVELGLPICFVDFFSADLNASGNFDIVSTNNLRPVYNMVRYLHGLHGVNRFCFVGDPSHCLSFQDRYFGMVQALVKDSVEHSAKDDILRSDNFNYSNPRAIKAEIQKLKYMPECFICSNDFIARTVCRALKLLNVSVPKQCMVVGYDNVADSYSLEPRITTFDVDKEFLGTEAVRTLVFRINNPNIPSRKILIAPKPILRDSTKR